MCIYIYIGVCVCVCVCMQYLTTIMTGHGNIPSYLHRLKIIGSPECACKHGIQTVDHLIFQLSRLKNKRETLETSLLKVGNWPVSKVN